MTTASPPEAPERPSRAGATVAEVMRSVSTTVSESDHVAAAAYLMRHARVTVLVVTDLLRTGRPVGIITQADIARAVADGKNVNEVRIHDLMSVHPTVLRAATSIRDAAEIMSSGSFRHLPVVGDAGLIGIVDLADVYGALLEVAPG